MTSVSPQTTGVWTMPSYHRSRTYYYYSRNRSRMRNLHLEASVKPVVLSSMQFLAAHHQARHLPHSLVTGLEASHQPYQLVDTISREHPEELLRETPLDQAVRVDGYGAAAFCVVPVVSPETWVFCPIAVVLADGEATVVLEVSSRFDMVLLPQRG